MKTSVLRFSHALTLVAGAALISGCVPESRVRKAIEKNPSIVFDALKNNPEQFMEVATKASTEARTLVTQRQRDAEYKNPKQPEVEAGRAIRGNPSAPILIVEYSDFQCPYCQRGAETVEEVRKKYGDNVRVLFKHLPLPMHAEAPLAARYFEALNLQSAEKAWAFHDEVFAHQAKLNEEKEAFLKKAAEKTGADMKRLAEDLQSPVVLGRIEADRAEAQRFDISGTPGFLINGISLKGAYPLASFDEIIQRLEKK